MAKRRTSEEMFDSVVANALDFLRRSVTELEDSPKYSVIHFCAAIELFLKARLMVEHWSLVDEKPEAANIDRFTGGEFKSVGMEAAISRLANIAGLTMRPAAQQTFSTLRKHRNKLVHFFHPDYAGPDAETIERVVVEQTRGWFHLHRLLTKDWKNEFANHQDEIDELHELIRRQRGYLQAKFESLQSAIEKGRERGAVFGQCESCGFEASRTENIVESLFSTTCLVCEMRSSVLREGCPKCGEIVQVSDAVSGEYCQDCEAKIDFEYLLEKYARKPEYLGEGIYEENVVYCSMCEHSDKSVVPFGETWVCLSCLNDFDHIEQCEWCGESIAGDIDGSYVSGCLMCDGMAGHYADD